MRYLVISLSLLMVVKFTSGYTECYSKSNSLPDYVFADYLIIDYPLNNNTFKLDIHTTKGKINLYTLSGEVLGCHKCCVKYFSGLEKLSIKVKCLDPECHLYDHSKITPFPLIVTKVWFICIVCICVIINIFLLWFFAKKIHN